MGQSPPGKIDILKEKKELQERTYIWPNQRLGGEAAIAATS
jgi:hypothetical protein